MRTTLAAAFLLLAATAARPDDRADAMKAIEDANAALKAGKPKEAVELGRKAVKLDPANPDGHLCIGKGLLDQRDNAGAAAAFREVIRLDPARAAAHDRLGDALLKMGKFD